MRDFFFMMCPIVAMIVAYVVFFRLTNKRMDKLKSDLDWALSCHKDTQSASERDVKRSLEELAKDLREQERRIDSLSYKSQAIDKHLNIRVVKVQERFRVKQSTDPFESDELPI